MEARPAHALIDCYTHKCLAIKGARRITATGVIETLADVMLFEGIPNYNRSDIGPEVVAKVLRRSLIGMGACLYIEAAHYIEHVHCGKIASVNPSMASSTTSNVRTHRSVTDPQRHSSSP